MDFTKGMLAFIAGMLVGIIILNTQHDLRTQRIESEVMNPQHNVTQTTTQTKELNMNDGSKLPDRPSPKGTMEDIVRQEQPIEKGELVEVVLTEIRAPKEGSKEDAPDQAFFKVQNNANRDWNGKLIVVALFSNVLNSLINKSEDFGWDETGYFQTCIGLTLFATIGIRTYTPEGSTEKIPQNTLTF